MDLAQRELLVARVLSGRTRLRLVEGRREKTFWLRSPTALERYEAAEVYHEALAGASLRGVPDQDDTQDLLRRKGLWDDARAQELEQLEKDVETLKVKLYESLFRSNDADRARLLLAANRRRQAELLTQKHAWDVVTTTGHAATVRARFLAIRCLLRADGTTPVYAGNDEDCPLAEEAAQEAARLRPSEDQFRELARTEPWRGIWACRHSEGQVFGRPAAELTDEQRALTVWTRIYDNAYESPECPPESVLADDDAFDGWLILQRRKREESQKANQAGSVTSEKIRNAGEVFVLAETPEDVRRINELNDEEAARVKRQRQEFLQQKGAVHEAHMPDSKARIRAEMMARMASGGK
jgi:hypothetical protein